MKNILIVWVVAYLAYDIIALTKYRRRCRAGYYLDDDDYECRPCMINCLLCESAWTCTKCDYGYGFNGYRCERNYKEPRIT
mgnify:CR=1 FL=1